MHRAVKARKVIQISRRPTAVNVCYASELTGPTNLPNARMNNGRHDLANSCCFLWGSCI